jgi:hypothetical protein
VAFFMVLSIMYMTITLPKKEVNLLKRLRNVISGGYGLFFNDASITRDYSVGW